MKKFLSGRPHVWAASCGQRPAEGPHAGKPRAASKKRFKKGCKKIF